jgi:hypothetical protein
MNEPFRSARIQLSTRTPADYPHLSGVKRTSVGARANYSSGIEQLAAVIGRHAVPANPIDPFRSVRGNRTRGENRLNSLGDPMPIDIHFPDGTGGCHVKVRAPASGGFNGAT